MPIRIAINGFGRIGRSFFKQALERQELEIVAVNDLGSIENLAYLLQYDTAYGVYEHAVTVEGNQLKVDSKSVQVLAEREPAKLPWKDLGIDIVVESTGLFTSRDKVQMHLDAGAKRVVISAPAKGDVATVLMGVNEEKMKDNVVTCNASCTTNATGPVAAVLSKNPGIKKALLATIHGYTSTQSLVDGPVRGDKDLRRGRAAAMNIIPSTTGAAEATAKALPNLENIFTGIAFRVPVVTGSVIDFTFLAARQTSAEEINDILEKASCEPRWKGILRVSRESLVSSDIVKSTHATIIDAEFTRVIGGDLVKVVSWYDNEWGYCSMLVLHVLKAGEEINAGA